MYFKSKLLISLSTTAFLASILFTGCAPVAVDTTRTTGMMVEDTAIELKAASLLREEPGIGNEGHVNAISYNGNVLLVGQVPTESAKIRAEEILNNFTKVKRVFNELTIAAPSSYLTRTGDAYVTSKVKGRLIAEKTLNANRIKVVTENGVVYLMGVVMQTEANIAIEIARTTGGVQRVVPLFEVM